MDCRIVHIRTADPADAASISCLIRGLAHHFTVEPDGRGADRFFETITEDKIRSYTRDRQFYYLMAENDNDLVGVGATKASTHLYHLFVRDDAQGLGIGRRLWDELRSSFPKGAVVTVHSTPIAVPVYERFGFVVTGDKVRQDGIEFVPMEWTARIP